MKRAGGTYKFSSGCREKSAERFILVTATISTKKYALRELGEFDEEIPHTGIRVEGVQLPEVDEC